MKQWTNLKTHLNRHLGIRPHRCPDKLLVIPEDAVDGEHNAVQVNCHYRTADQASLTKHRRDVHQVIPRPRAAKGAATSSRCRSSSVALSVQSRQSSVQPYSYGAALPVASSLADHSRPPDALSTSSASAADFARPRKPVCATPSGSDNRLKPMPSSGSQKQSLPPLRQLFPNLGVTWQSDAARSLAPPLANLPIPLTTASHAPQWPRHYYAYDQPPIQSQQPYTRPHRLQRTHSKPAISDCQPILNDNYTSTDNDEVVPSSSL